MNEGPPYDGDRPGWQGFRCSGCDMPSFAFGIFEVMSGHVQAFFPQKWYPLGPLVRDYPKSVPESITKFAIEAHGCLSVGHHQGALMCARSVIEASAKAKGITSGSLEKKIDALFTGGFIYEHVKEAAHEIRHMGNEAAHGDLVDDPISSEEAYAVLELMDMVLDGVFISPGKAAAQKAARAAKKAQSSGA
ncbi:hypothetical protein KCMC57_65010 (plasmid) [Kitasatospora sp. CMC57]|uniref:DUF4145 domain-containing protein n=2 Tax=Kitasatospora sp. CMC57 TaxID=3231513 RepID=A0AB33KE59_9ACTN